MKVFFLFIRLFVAVLLLFLLSIGPRIDTILLIGLGYSAVDTVIACDTL